MKLLLLALLFTSFSAMGQWKSYRLINNDRDTINCIDNSDLKQGRWRIRYEEMRGEPGYEEEGMYKDGKKEGVWRLYSLMGDLVGVENYRWGNKDGTARYFDINGGLVREENWKAVNPDNPYDTVDVNDLNDPNKITRVQIKLEGRSLKHGTWKWYSPAGSLMKSEEYFLDKIKTPNAQPQATTASTDGSTASTDSTGAAKPAPPKKVKPKEVMDFEKKTGKRKTKVQDGSAGL